jgi:hypothetical protein
MKVAFDHIDANSLDVWNVSIPIDEDANLEAQVKALRLHEKKPLWALKGLLKIFSDLDKETLHGTMSLSRPLLSVSTDAFFCNSS